MDEVRAHDDWPFELEAEGDVASRTRRAIVVRVQDGAERRWPGVAGGARASVQVGHGTRLRADLDLDRAREGNVLAHVCAPSFDGYEIRAGARVVREVIGPRVGHRAVPAGVCRIEGAAEEVVGRGDRAELRVDAIALERRGCLHVVRSDERLQVND